MSSTLAKYAKLDSSSTGNDSNTTSTSGAESSSSLIFPLDLLTGSGQDTACVTFFPNLIKNSAVKMSGSAALSASDNPLQSPYGEVPIIHTSSNHGSILRKNGGKEVFSNLYSRSGESMTLPMPRSLEFSYSTNWQVQELGAAAGAIDQLSDYEKLASTNGVKLGAMLAANTAASVVSSLAKGQLKTKETLQLATASVANNYAETMFQSVSNRQIPFSWTLQPRNAKEATAIDNMLRLFRFHMLPEYRQDIGNGNAYLLYPSSFDIVFWIDGAPNAAIPRISTCALTTMSINQTPNGQYIPMIDGKPQAVTVSLTFVELQKLSKDNVGTPELNTTF